jgi:HEAT repeat protein
MKLVAVLLAASSVAAAPLCRSEEECRTRSRQAFLDVERTARLAASEQQEALPRLYLETYPGLEGLLAHLRPYRIPPGDGLTPEELAARIEAEAGWGWLAEIARSRAREILAGQRAKLVGLVASDFRDGSPAALHRALRVVGDLRLWDFLDDAVRVLESAPEELAGRAAYALRDLNDPRAIEPLIRKDPQHPTRYFEILRYLQRNRPPHPLLVRLLDSADETTRRQAAYALEESIRPK